MKTALKNLVLVFRHWQYGVLALVLAFVFYTFNALVVNIGILSTTLESLELLGTLELFGKLWLGYPSTISLYTLSTLLGISLLFGILFALIVYKMRSFAPQTKKTGPLASLGIFLGLLAPGCVACGVGFFSLLGISAASLSFLPFHGEEIAIIAIVLLLFSIIRFAQNLMICKVKPQNHRK